MMKFNNPNDLIKYVHDNNARIGMRINNKKSIDGYDIGCIGIIGTIYHDDKETKFMIGDNQCSIGRNTSERMMKYIKNNL